MLTPEERQELKKELLQDMISAMNDLMAKKFQGEPQGLEVESVEGEIETPEGKAEFGPEIEVSPIDEMPLPPPPMPEEDSLDKLTSSMKPIEEEEEEEEESEEE